MKIIKVVRFVIVTAIACCVLATGIYHFTPRDPIPIKVDPKIYDDYAGYYDYGHGYVITLRREGGVAGY